MPQTSQREPDDDDVPRKSWRREELTNGEKVGNAGNGQWNKKGRIAHPAEIARTDVQRDEQNHAQAVNPAGWSKRQTSPAEHCPR